MTEEGAKHKFEKQLPAPEVKKGVKNKRSQKKPWVINKEWKAGSVFEKKTWKVGEKETIEYYTLEEIFKKRDEGKLETFGHFMTVFWGPKPFATLRYSSKKAALTAWGSFVKKGEIDSRAIYKLVNKDTGEEIEL